MPNTPQLRSREQVAGDLVSGIESRLPFEVDLHQGSVISQIVESVSRSNFRSYAAVVQMVDALSSDRAVGEALQRLAKDKKVPIFPAIPSSGPVSITDTSFQKIESSVYTGQPAPVAGTLVLFVSDASSWPATGVIYLGRGTTNFEGPLQYSSVASIGGGAYWQVNLSVTSPTTKFHNIGESAVVGQGGIRTINSGTVVQTAQGSSVSAVRFTTTSAAVIQDGETTVDEVPVVCAAPGPSGNVPRGGIKEALGLAFSATVFNPNPFFNGRDADTDAQIQERIKAYEQAKTKGTAVAIQLYSLDVVAQDELKRVTSANTVSFADNRAALVFDDGTGYEYSFAGIGIEQVIDQAIGGERELQLRQRPVAQARIESSKAAPFNIPDQYQLSVTVMGVTTVHTFSSSDFKVPAAATAVEVAASINGNPNLNFLASTSRGGTRIVVYPRSPSRADVQVNRTAASDASLIIGLPAVQEFTLRLYRNDEPLYEEGILALVSTRSRATWSPSISAGDTLVYSVDGTTEITVTFTLSAFQVVDISATPSSGTSVSVWASVMNNIMPGVSAVANGEVIELSSNLGANDRAKISITGGSLKDKMFAVGATVLSTGRTSDYTFNRQTGQLSLVAQAAALDHFSAGSPFTRGKVVTQNLPSGVSVDGRAWFVLDGSAAAVPNELQATSQVRFTRTIGTRTILLEARSGDTLLAEGFGSVQAGDWLLVWANPTDNVNLVNNQVMLRVQSVSVGSITVSGDVAGASSTTAWFTPLIDRIVFVRSLAPMQRFEFSSSDLSTLATSFSSQLTGVNSEIVGSKIRVSTKTAGADGEILVAAVDEGGKTLGFTAVGTPVLNIPSQLAFVATADSEAGFPNFNHGQLTGADDDLNVIDAQYENLGGNREDLVQILDGYDAAAFRAVPASDLERRILATNFNLSPDRIRLLTPSYMRSGNSGITASFNSQHPTLLQGDRYFLRAPYQFDSGDSLALVIDREDKTKAYNAPVARRLLVSANSTPTLQDLSASDAESTLGLNDPGSFNGFSFLNFLAWRQARAELLGSTYDLLVSAGDFGPSGNKLRTGFVYPSDPLATSLQLSLAHGDAVDAGIVIPVKTLRAPNWDASSSFTVGVTTVGGKDQVTYTWRAGTQPNFLGAAVVAGDVAILSHLLGFLSANDGYSAKVASLSATAFTLELPAGRVIADAPQWDSIDNTNGVVTFIRAAGHGIQAGEQFGTYDTSILTGITRPFDSGSYIAISATSTQVVASAPPGVPGGSISSGTHASNIVTINATAHGLFVGNIVKVSGAGAPYDGLYEVSAAPSANQFQYVVNGSSGPIASGRFDFQSVSATATVASVTSISRAASTNIVTVNTAAAHGFVPGNLVSIASVLLTAWVASTYAIGDVVRDPLNNLAYKNILAGASATNPSLDPTRWAPTPFDLNGTFPVQTTPSANQFTYFYSDATGSASGTTASATLYGYQAKLARSIGGPASLLSFADASTTAQEVIDFLSTSAPGRLSATLFGAGTGADLIARSTEDEQAASNYLSGTISATQATKGSRLAVVTANVNVKAGARVVLTLGSVPYSGEYVVLRSVQNGPNWDLTIVTSVFASSTGAVAGGTGTFNGSTPYVMLADGENAVLSQNLGALPASPQLTMKKAWAMAPTVGEEVRLVAITADQVSRFWNRLVVTGLSNVATVENSEYGRQVQVTTQLAGSSGSVQVAGGSANAKVVALVGSGSSSGNRLGSVSVPFDLRNGIVAGHWLRVENQIRNSKQLAFSSTTFLQAFTDGLAITTSENFVQQRSTTADNTTKLRVEKHGQFLAILGISGTSIGLAAAGVKEGDWVRIKNVSPKLYSGATSYLKGNKVKDGVGNRYVAVANSTGQLLTNLAFWQPYSEWTALTAYTSGNFVLYNGRLWEAAAGSTGVTPGSSVASWEPREIDAATAGIFRVVRTYGEDAFWVENANAIEEVTRLWDPADLTFFSYDSVMPGDTLVISGTILGSNNVGRYAVLDQAADGSTDFPAPKRIYTASIPSATSPTLLGLSSNQVSVEEGSPLSAIKRVFAVGPSGTSQAIITLDSPELADRFSSSNGAFLTHQGKVGLEESTSFGLDGYRYLKGLPKQLNTVIYGDPQNPTVYPGVRAAGTAVDIVAAIARRIKVDLAIRTKIGVPFTEVVDRVKAAVAGYVNQLGVGEQVALSQIVAAAGSVNGVTSVSVTFPTYSSSSDLIAVGADEKALVVDPTNDVTVSILGT